MLSVPKTGPRGIVERGEELGEILGIFTRGMGTKSRYGMMFRDWGSDLHVKYDIV